jgi:myo-inositol-1(or 4)-monophosphatase
MKELAVATRAAKMAGALLMEHLGRLKDIRYKSVRDPVSEADTASEALIADIIGSAFPSDGFLGEEDVSGSSGEADGSGRRWVVDPLDGTVNFAHGYPCFCVSIALEQDGEVVLGVVYDPAHREIYSAVRGGGAALNGNTIRVSKTRRLIRSLVVTGFPYDAATNPGRIFTDVEGMVKASQGVRRDGAAALDLCYIASGRLDGFWELRLKPWDTAAGMLIVREAGGRVTDFAGRPFEPGMQEILATNGLVHREMMGVLDGNKGRKR